MACSFRKDVFLSCKNVAKTQILSLVQTPKKTITAVIDRYLSAYSAQNMEGLLQVFLIEDPGFYFLGTGVDERASTKVELEQIFQLHFSQAKALAAKAEYMSVYVHPPFAFLVGEFMFRIGFQEQGELVFTPRFSAVLRQVGSNWLIQQLHYSVPWLEQPLNLAFPVS